MLFTSAVANDDPGHVQELLREGKDPNADEHWGTMTLPYWTTPCLSILISLLIGPASAHADKLIDRVTQTISDGRMMKLETFQLDIDDGRIPLNLPSDPVGYKGYWFVENVHVNCIGGCSSAITYNEKFDDIPISAFVLRDDSPDLVTLWATGSAYAIRILTKVLDEHSVTAPRIEVTDDGALVVTLSNPSLPAALKKWPNSQIWRWNGKIYRVVS
jgi:hypothetical protein